MTKHQALQDNLADETLLWSEEPEATALFGWDAAWGILFSLLWLSIVSLGFWDLDTGGMNSPVGYLFLTMGIVIFGSSLWQPLTAPFTIYGITDKRLLIVRRFPWATEVESYFSADIDFIRKAVKRGGRGTIIFTTVKHTGSKGRTRYEDVGFFGIDDVNSVEALIRKIFRSATPP